MFNQIMEFFFFSSDVSRIVELLETLDESMSWVTALVSSITVYKCSP